MLTVIVQGRARNGYGSGVRESMIVIPFARIIGAKSSTLSIKSTIFFEVATPGHYLTQLPSLISSASSIMPKTAAKKGNANRSSPYSPGASKAKAANNIFKMNTDLGYRFLEYRNIHSLIRLHTNSFPVSISSKIPAWQTP